MKALQRTLSVIALLILIAQTIRHTYHRWLEPRSSVLDRYDRPLTEKVSGAKSLDELVRLYDPVRKEADRVRKERHQPSDELPMANGPEPFRSELELKQAIQDWEAKARELHSLRFYWSVGLVLVALGFALFRSGGRWLGLTLEIAGFSEFIYWTSPTFFGSAVSEFDTLLNHKIVLSIASVALLLIAIRQQNVFRNGSTEEGAPTGA